MTELSLTAEARLLDKKAAHLEAQAAARDERAARWYRAGSYNYVLSLDTAEGYRKQARQLRARAQEYRSLARMAGEDR